MTLIGLVKGREIDSILSGTQLPSCRLDLVISFKGEGLYKMVTKLLLEALIVCRFIVVKSVVLVLMIELIR